MDKIVDDCSVVLFDVTFIVTLLVAFADLHQRVLLACDQQCCKEQVRKEHVLSQPQGATAARVSCGVCVHTPFYALCDHCLYVEASVARPAAKLPENTRRISESRLNLVQLCHRRFSCS